MERALAAHGFPRRRFEAPHEYLNRVLGELSGGRRAAARLTALFERARFSPHDRRMIRAGGLGETPPRCRGDYGDGVLTAAR